MRRWIPFPLLLGGCAQGVLHPGGPVARAELQLLQNATIIMIAVVVPVILMTLGFAWWYRKGNPHARRNPGFTYSGRVEMVVWSIPILTVGFLGGLAWVSSHELDPARPLKRDVRPIRIEVVSLDWKWLFIYPDAGVASVNQLVVPAGVPIEFRLTSTGVMNSMLVPELGSQIYTMSGMATRLHLQADRPGTYRGFSAQFSGDRFSDMRFNVVAVPSARYVDWLKQVHTTGRPLDHAGYDRLRQPGTADTQVFASVPSGLFDTIVNGSGHLETTQSPNGGASHVR